MPAAKRYTFSVVVEPDEDRWHAYCPMLVERGAGAWGATRAEALENIKDVLELVGESLRDHGERIPQE